jgi:hypothetical protein
LDLFKERQQLNLGLDLTYSKKPRETFCFQFTKHMNKNMGFHILIN